MLSNGYGGKSMSERGGGGEFFAGFLVGALVGAVAALLMAPQSGDETRQRIQERGIELKDMAGDLSVQAREAAADLQERGRIVLQEQKGKLEQAIEEGKSAAAKKRDEMLGALEGEEAAA
jgi:gas vesicle protein